MSDSPIYENLEVLGPRVLARPLSELDVTRGGIVRPDSAKVPQNRAVVEKVGPGEQVDGQLRALPFQPGDVVFYQKFAGAWIVLDERERLMLHADEIQARMPAERVKLLRHGDDERCEHLEGESCLICLELLNQQSKARLEAQRAEMVSGASNSAS